MTFWSIFVLDKLQQMQSTSQAQIFILTGFFGVGKTTFIRKLLANPHNQRYAVIQNQFAEGQMGIQQPLIVDQTGVPFSSFLQLPNGCICCSAKNDLIAAVEYIIANTPVRKILVETNGMADPLQSIKQFWFDEQALIKAQLHSVIAVVSAKRWKVDSEKDLFERQVVAANKLLISFVDQVDKEQCDQVSLQLKKMNCEGQIWRNDLTDPTEVLKGISLFSKDALQKLDAIEVNHHEAHHKIKPNFLKGLCKLNSKLQVEQAIGELLWQSGQKILRIKGVICLQNEPNVLELQGVEDIFEIKSTKSSKTIYNNQSRILIIGEDINRQLFTKTLTIL